jgi:hypothetical protein
MTYESRIEAHRIPLCKPGSEYHSGVESMRELAAYIAAEADAEISAMRAVLSRIAKVRPESDGVALAMWAAARQALTTHPIGDMSGSDLAFCAAAKATP